MTDTPKRIAVITGASRGIGRAVATRLARDGRHVVLCARSEAPLNDLKSQIESAGGHASVCAFDVGDAVAVQTAIEGIATAHGRLDILVNNAGITKDGLALRMSDEDWDAVLDTNLKSAFVAIRAGARAMMKGKFGRIINVSSTSGVVGNAGQANYAAAKAGMLGLTKSIARELGGKGITCNAVAPGFIETDMTANLPQQVRDGVMGMIAVKRFGTADDIAACIAYLTSDEAGFITGQTVCVDGGMTMC
ncbi:MAG: 3-oxoacyl-[acyl-carrier-protein] reductase [Phycisphaerales bacterium]